MLTQMELDLPGVPQRVEAAATKPAVASRSEIGYAQAVLNQWWLLDEGETTPELQWPRSIAVYDQMRRTDAQVTSLLEAVSLPIRRTPWRIDPAGARATVVKFVATDLGLPIVGKGPGKAPARTKGKFSWPDHLRLALLELVFGHMFFEQVYAVNDAGTEAHLKKLAPRMPSTIDQISVAADGGLQWIKQRWTTDSGEPQPIPVDRLVAYVRNREGGNWLGQSILRPAYKNWLLKDRLLRVQAQTIERNGMGVPLYKAQEGATSADITAGKTMATLWRSGEAAGSAVPFGADLVLRGVEGTLPDANPAIRYHDEQIARAALAHFLNLGTQTGSWALGTTFADFFVYALQTLAQQIADVTTQHVIEDLVDINFGPDEPAPKLVFDEIGSQQAATAQAIKTLIDAGVIHPDQVLEESARQQYGLPPADPATATQPAGTAPAETVPEPTPTGALSVAARRAPRRRARPARKAATPRRPVVARYNPSQLRDPGGEGGGRWVKAPSLPDFDLDESELAAEVDGTFGTVRFGVFPSGDVRLAFHEGPEARALDLGEDEVAELRDSLNGLTRERRRFGVDGSPDEEVDSWWFGYDEAHRATLWGNGVIQVTFGAEDDDPWTLTLDPPDDEGGDDVEVFLEGVDDTLAEVDAAQAVRARKARRRRRRGMAVSARHRFDPDQPRDPGGEGGGRWVKEPSAGDLKDALEHASDGEPDQLIVPPGAGLGEIVRDVLHTSHGEVAVAGSRDGARLWFGKSDSGQLDDEATSRLLQLLESVGYDDGNRYPRVDSVATYGPDGELVAYVGVRQADPNSVNLEMLDDSRWDLTAAESDSVGAALLRTSYASRMRTPEGRVDVWPQDDRNGVLEVPQPDGGRLSVDGLTYTDASQLSRAVTSVAQKGGTKKVTTKTGPMQVRRVTQPQPKPKLDLPPEEGDDGEDHQDPHLIPDVIVELSPVKGGWTVTAPAGELEDVLDHLSSGLGSFEEWRAAGPVSAAAGRDTHPGGEQLKQYWLRGEGAAKWSTWTELKDHLRKYMPVGKAKRTAANWFHERYQIWPGSDLNRVKHGKPPRGQKVGPG